MESNELLGLWKTDPLHIPTIELYGRNASMEFKDNGDLIYLIEEEGKFQTILLTYQIVEDKLITDQPSMPGKEITIFRILDKKLQLDHEGVISSFVRA
ncbi:hypothetical protein [Chitinophaga polysaccharea]|uniref:hypothetical protein n=1 Tax=Chitinophaga polysaccharea TaxID=1293035 RepID=UPI0011589BAF|nr:hypothetical protein [Chitinophaga polysaccharea]